MQGTITSKVLKIFELQLLKRYYEYVSLCIIR